MSVEHTRLSLLLSEEEIARIVERLASEIDRDYFNRDPVMVCNLKGAFIFLADLVRQMTHPIRGIEFIRLSSYGMGTQRGKARLLVGLPENRVRSKHVILVEDIVDTGLSAQIARNYLQGFEPASLKVCSLLSKPERREVAVDIDYLGTTVPDRFVVGYGLDLDSRYRDLADIFTVDQE